MATDMKQHFSILSQFCSKHRLRPTPTASILAGGSTSHGDHTSATGSAADSHRPIDDADKLLCLQVRGWHGGLYGTPRVHDGYSTYSENGVLIVNLLYKFVRVLRPSMSRCIRVGRRFGLQ